VSDQLIDRFDTLCRLLPADQKPVRVEFANKAAFLKSHFEICRGVLSSLERLHHELETMSEFADETGLINRVKTVYTELRCLIESDDLGSVF
jgi:hypothetical protein